MTNVKITTNGFVTNNKEPVIVINLNGQVAVEMFYSGSVKFGAGLTPEFEANDTVSDVIDDMARKYLLKMKSCEDRTVWLQNIEKDIDKYTKMIKQSCLKKGGK